LPLSLQLPQLLPLRQTSAEITDPVEDESSGGDATTFVASLALLLQVRAVLHNVSQLNRVAVRVTFPDQRQLFYQPKPSEVRNMSATTDSLQVSLVLSHSAWTGIAAASTPLLPPPRVLLVVKTLAVIYILHAYTLPC